jgi:hypothetical protein
MPRFTHVVLQSSKHGSVDDTRYGPHVTNLTPGVVALFTTLFCSQNMGQLMAAGMDHHVTTLPPRGSENPTNWRWPRAATKPRGRCCITSSRARRRRGSRAAAATMTTTTTTSSRGGARRPRGLSRGRRCEARRSGPRSVLVEVMGSRGRESTYLASYSKQTPHCSKVRRIEGSSSLLDRELVAEFRLKYEKTVPFGTKIFWASQSFLFIFIAHLTTRALAPREPRTHLRWGSWGGGAAAALLPGPRR